MILLILVGTLTNGQAQHFNYDDISSRPRLLLHAGEENRIKDAINKYPSLAGVHQQIMDTCEVTLNYPPIQYQKEGKRLLAISRIALRRIYYLAYAYRVTGDERYMKRAEQEMLSVSRFENWNPTHFLD